MCDFNYNWWFIYKNVIYDEDGRKTPKYKRENEKQGKIPRLVALPSPRLRNGGLPFSGVRKTPKTENKPDLP